MGKYARLVDLLQVPVAGHDGDEQANDVEQRET
jgi:hypothetical protein